MNEHKKISGIKSVYLTWGENKQNVGNYNAP